MVEAFANPAAIPALACQSAGLSNLDKKVHKARTKHMAQTCSRLISSHSSHSVICLSAHTLQRNHSPAFDWEISVGASGLALSCLPFRVNSSLKRWRGTVVALHSKRGSAGFYYWVPAWHPSLTEVHTAWSRGHNIITYIILAYIYGSQIVI